MNTWREWSSPVRVAVVLLGLAVLWDLLALARLVGNDQAASLSPLILSPPPAIARRALDDPRVFTTASARTPFASESTAQPATMFSAAPSAPAELPRLTGTVVQGANSFVIIERVDGTINLLHLGDRAAGLTLHTVNPGTATFADSTGRRVVLHAARPETAMRQ